MKIEKMTSKDFDEFWPTFKEVVLAEETYAYDANLSHEEALATWLKVPASTYVAKENGELLGSYYIKKNAAGPSSHICNCGYMVVTKHRGKGVARAMCTHSLNQAVELGFTAMQFNSVVSTNEVAVKLWKDIGFDIIGTIPKAYNHKKHGPVDCYIMFKKLV